MVKRPWYEKRPELFRSLQQEIGKAYPNLHFSVRNGTVLLSGSFPLVDGGNVIDRFFIEIEMPPNFPKGIPLVFEIGGQIPRTIERHIFPSGDACLYDPLQLSEIFPEGASLLDFLNGPVRSFFVSQSYYELTGEWPFGEWSHGQEAFYEYYGAILNTKDRIAISRYYQIIAQKEIKGHWSCPCGSGKVLRHCHYSEVAKLHKDYQYAINQWRWQEKRRKSNT